MFYEMKRRAWTRPELICVLELYQRLPFGQFHARNAEVQELASQIDRTPASVALKLCNFASLDPKHQARGVAGMGNTSRQDREIWDDFNSTASSSRLSRSTAKKSKERKTPRSIDVDSNLRCQRIYPVEGSKKRVDDLRTIGIKMNRAQAIHLARVLLAVTQDWDDVDLTGYRFEKRKSDDSYMLTVTHREK
jgi:hypothetical protein